MSSRLKFLFAVFFLAIVIGFLSLGIFAFNFTIQDSWVTPEHQYKTLISVLNISFMAFHPFLVLSAFFLKSIGRMELFSYALFVLDTLIWSILIAWLVFRKKLKIKRA